MLILMRVPFQYSYLAQVVKINQSCMQIERRSVKLVKRSINNDAVGLVHEHHMIVNEI